MQHSVHASVHDYHTIKDLFLKRLNHKGHIRLRVNILYTNLQLPHCKYLVNIVENV